MAFPSWAGRGMSRLANRAAEAASRPIGRVAATNPLYEGGLRAWMPIVLKKRSNVSFAQAALGGVRL